MFIRRTVLVVVFSLVFSAVWVSWFGSSARLTAAGAGAPSRAESLTLDELVSGKLKIVDLGWSLNDKNPYWPADDYEPFRLKTIATIEKNGVLSKAFFCPEHLGTHLDAP